MLWHAFGGQPRKFYRQRTIPAGLVAAEIGRTRQAIQVVSFVLENSIQQVTKRLGKSYAELFVALREILHDSSLLKHCRKTSKTGALTPELNNLTLNLSKAVFRLTEPVS